MQRLARWRSVAGAGEHERSVFKSVFTACLSGGRAGFVVVAADVGAAVVVVAFVVEQFGGGELARGSAGSWRSWLASIVPSA